jgi:hypothetical protein
MKPLLPATAAFFLLAATLPSQSPAPTSASTSEFKTQIQPILQTNCYPCHSGNRPPGGLRLDARSFAMRAITPGNADASRIIHRIEGAGNEPQMPFGLAPLQCPSAWPRSPPNKSPP